MSNAPVPRGPDALRRFAGSFVLLALALYLVVSVIERLLPWIIALLLVGAAVKAIHLYRRRYW